MTNLNKVLKECGFESSLPCNDHKDVTMIMFRTATAEVKIPTFSMRRLEAIEAYEAMLLADNVVFACAFVENGGRI